MTADRERFSFVIDPNASPADWDQALARYLLRYVRSSLADPPAAETDNGTPGEEKREV